MRREYTCASQSGCERLRIYRRACGKSRLWEKHVRPNTNGTVEGRLQGTRKIPLAKVGIPSAFRRRERSEEHTSELQSRLHLVCRLLLEKKASLQRTFKKSFTSFSHSTRNKTRDGLIRVRNIRALNGRFNTSITHAYSIVIGTKHITLKPTGGGFLTASKQFRHGATSKSRSNTAIFFNKHKPPHLIRCSQTSPLTT